MKTKKHFIIFVSLFALATKCEKDDVVDENNYASFRSYFSCYVNGEYFEPQGMFGCLRISSSYYEEDYYNVGSGGGELRVRGRNCHADTFDVWSVGIVIHSVFEPETIDLVADNRYHNVTVLGGYDSINNTDYHYTNTISGELIIEKLVPHVTGETNGVVIGTFEFTVHNGHGDTAHVTDGQFGIKLPNP